MSTPLSIGLIGQKFMGRAHSNAWNQAPRFFDLPRQPRLELVSALDQRELKSFAKRWGWSRFTDNWRDLAADESIELVDIGTPNDLHAEQAIAMLEAGKHVACEKPLAGTLEDARAMRAVAKKHKRQKTFVWFNYRRCAAVALAQKLVAAGKIGALQHVRASYLQDWGGPDVPLLWRFQKKHAGSGAHGDLNAHIVDMARFISGDEVKEVNGAVAKTFVKERKRLDGKGLGRSTVDDAVLFLTTFKSGAIGSFEASRVAHGNQNKNTIELNGTLGSLKFDFEDMNLLWFYDARDDPKTRGWRRIMCTAAEHHPYVANWWPDAHVLGYEHGFVNMAADICKVLGGKKPEVALPDFEDAYQTQRVLEAALLAAKERCAIPMSEVR
jgi:predicted dehydrogenase